MRNVLTLLTVFLLVTAFVANVLADVPADVRADVRADDGPFRFDFEEVAPDVWVGVRADTFRWPVMGNVTFVVSDEGVVVFDGGGMPTMADQVIAKIRALTEAPVTHVITSHWHGDHNFGVFRYGEEWPGIEFIAHRFTREVMQSARINYVDREQGFHGAQSRRIRAHCPNGRQLGGGGSVRRGSRNLRTDAGRQRCRRTGISRARA